MRAVDALQVGIPVTFALIAHVISCASAWARIGFYALLLGATGAAFAGWTEDDAPHPVRWTVTAYVFTTRTLKLLRRECSR